MILISFKHQMLGLIFMIVLTAFCLRAPFVEESRDKKVI